jgi:hypothetical protein
VPFLCQYPSVTELRSAAKEASMKVIVERDLSTATCGDVAITAAEGGIGYWSVIDKYKWTRWVNDEESFGPGSLEVPEDFVFYTITYADYAGPMTSEECQRSVDITPALIRRGIQLFLTGAGNFEGRMFDDMDDFAAMDSNEADCVIQLGCFGEVIYG